MEVFSPGERIDTLGIVKREAQAIASFVNARVPARIHVTPIDCNRFGFGQAGGGGIGFAIDVGNLIRVQIARDFGVTTNAGRHSVLVEHYAKVFAAVTKTACSYSFFLHTSPMMRQHFGLGSSVAVACGTLYALNVLNGSPLTLDEMRLLVARNFVEEFRGMVATGLETGVGTSVILKGGISVVGGEIVETYRREFPAGHTVFVVDPATSRPESDQPESEDMLRRTFFLDGSYRYTKAYNVLMDIVPALHASDLRRFGGHVWDIQFSGTHLSMIQSYERLGQRIYGLLGLLKDSGADVCGLSSVGPAIFAICSTDREASLEQCISGYEYWKVGPDNTGCSVVNSEVELTKDNEARKY